MSRGKIDINRGDYDDNAEGGLMRVAPFTEEQAKAGKENIWPGRDDETKRAGADAESEGRKVQTCSSLTSIRVGGSSQVACRSMTLSLIDIKKSWGGLPLASQDVTCAETRVRNSANFLVDALNVN